MAQNQEEAHRVYIENMKADTEYKRALADWEPWKAIALAAGAGATIALALVALATLILAHIR